MCTDAQGTPFFAIDWQVVLSDCRWWELPPAAEADLSEALEIAEGSSMRLCECDAHLEWARLCRHRGDRDGLQRHVARARKLVEETGYGRRRREVEWLERQLGEGNPSRSR